MAKPTREDLYAGPHAGSRSSERVVTRHQPMDMTRGSQRQHYADWLGKRGAAQFTLPRYAVLGAEDLDTAAGQAREHAAAGEERPYVARRAPASMALLFMAFEAWVNMRLTMAFFFGRHMPVPAKEKLLELISRGSLTSKALRVPHYHGGETLAPSEHRDLGLLVQVRHELLHDLPATTRGGHIDHLDALVERGLLRDGTNVQGSHMLHPRLESYDLAWWAWDVVRDTADGIIVAYGDGNLDSAAEPHNFDLPGQWGISSPDEIESAAASQG